MSHFSAACRIEYKLKNDQSWLFSLLKPETESTMYVTFCGCRIECEAENQNKGAFLYSVKPKIVLYVTFLLRAEREYVIKNDQRWLISLLKPFVACWRYKRRIINAAVFYSVNQKKGRCMSHFCCVPNRVRDQRMFKVAHFFHSVNLKNVRYMSHQGHPARI